MASIFSRKRDLLYLIFFTTHIPIMFFVDFYPFYPQSIIPDFMHGFRKFYLDTYQDRNFINPSSWFTLYLWLEVVCHVPVSMWAVGGLLRDDPKVPIFLLIFAVEVAVTTSTCIADYLTWTGFSNAQKLELGKLYVPYLALSVFMAVDMCGRLITVLDRRQPAREKKVA